MDDIIPVRGELLLVATLQGSQLPFNQVQRSFDSCHGLLEAACCLPHRVGDQTTTLCESLINTRTQAASTKIIMIKILLHKIEEYQFVWITKVCKVSSPCCGSLLQLTMAVVRLLPPKAAFSRMVSLLS